MKMSPTRPRKKVSSAEEIPASAFAQADIKVNDKDAMTVAMTPMAMPARVRFRE